MAYKSYVPEFLQPTGDLLAESRLGKEVIGGIETGTTLATGLAGTLAGNIEGAATDIYRKFQGEDPTITKMRKWLKDNEVIDGVSMANNPDYMRVKKDYDFRISQIKRPEKIAEERASAMTYEPKSPEAQRNLEALGYVVEKGKIPPFVPNVGQVGRIGFKGKTPIAKVVKPKTTEANTSEALFDRARTYFGESNANQVSFQPSYLNQLTVKLQQDLKKANISDISSYGKDAMNVINKMKIRAKSKRPITINEMFEFQDLIDDIQVGNKPKSKFVADNLRSTLDDHVLQATKENIAKGSEESIKAFKQGQNYWGKAKKTADIENLMKNAEMRAGANYTQAQLVDAMRKEVQSFVKSKSKTKYYTLEEKAILQDFVKGGQLEAFLKRMSKLDPSSGGYVIGPTPAIAALSSYAGPEAALATYGGASVIGKGSKFARDLQMKSAINEMLNKLQKQSVQYKPGYRQLDLQTDLGLLLPQVYSDELNDGLLGK